MNAAVEICRKRVAKKVEGWGHTLVTSGNVGYLLILGSLLLGWPILRFVIHVSFLGLLLVCSRPGYNPKLSSKWRSSSSVLSMAEIQTIKQHFHHKLDKQQEYHLD